MANEWVTVAVPLIPYIKTMITVQFGKVFLILTHYVICITICDNITVLQGRELKFPEVGVACPRSPCWYLAWLTLHSLVSKCSSGTSWCPVIQVVPFLFSSFFMVSPGQPDSCCDQHFREQFWLLGIHYNGQGPLPSWNWCSVSGSRGQT